MGGGGGGGEDQVLTNLQKKEEESAFLRVLHKLAFLTQEVILDLSRGMSRQQGSAPASDLRGQLTVAGQGLPSSPGIGSI